MLLDHTISNSFKYNNLWVLALIERKDSMLVQIQPCLEISIAIFLQQGRFEKLLKIHIHLLKFALSIYMDILEIIYSSA